MLHEDLHRFRKVSSSIGNRVQGYFQLFGRRGHGCNDSHEPAGCRTAKALASSKNYPAQATLDNEYLCDALH